MKIYTLKFYLNLPNFYNTTNDYTKHENIHSQILSQFT